MAKNYKGPARRYKKNGTTRSTSSRGGKTDTAPTINRQDCLSREENGINPVNIAGRLKHFRYHWEDITSDEVILG